MFAARGAAVLDSDKIVHKLLKRTDVSLHVAQSLGTGPLPSGKEGRRRIAEIVFASDEQLTRLEQIIFPLVQAEIDEWLATDEVRSAPLAVVELPMLFEARMESSFDVIVLVTAPETLRQSRHEGRVGLADFERRASRQLDESDKRERSDFIYDNTGSPEELDEFIAAVAGKISGKPSSPSGAAEP